jgi:threonine/homoserine efflux transporter RhtA
MKYIKYLLYPTPGENFRFYIPLAIVVFLLFAGSVAVSIIYKRRKGYDFAFKRLFRKTALQLSLFAILFLFLLAVRYEGIPYFSARILLFAGFAWLAYFIYKTVKVFRTDYPREKENVKNLTVNKETKKVHKYLPNKRKK